MIVKALRVRAAVDAASATVAGLGGALIFQAITTNDMPQDWIPFHVASLFANASRWSDIYQTASASALFDLPPAFRVLAASLAGSKGTFEFSDRALTAFVSPPPAAFLIVPLQSLPWTTSALVSRLALVLPAAGAMLGFAVLECGDRQARMRWAVLCLIASPLLLYAVAVVQPSLWLFPAAVATVARTRWLQAIGGVALGLVIVAKATPIVVAVCLLAVGRRGIGATALVFPAHWDPKLRIPRGQVVAAASIVSPKY